MVLGLLPPGLLPPGLLPPGLLPPDLLPPDLLPPMPFAPRPFAPRSFAPHAFCPPCLLPPPMEHLNLNRNYILKMNTSDKVRVVDICLLCMVVRNNIQIWKDISFTRQ